MYDAIVVGAGPGGATAATLMSREGLRVVMLDKSSFPRDKICGDAISGKSVDALEELGLLHLFKRDDLLVNWGVSFSSPSGDEVSIPISESFDRPKPPGFICAREIFDNILVEQALSEGVELRQRVEVTGLLRTGSSSVGGVTVKSEDGSSAEIEAPLVIGADGAYSIVARELGLNQLDEDHYVAAIRAIYSGVTGFHERNFMEVHFIQESLPGYFWVFPMANGMANVGLGMLSSVIKKKNVKLKPMMEELTRHPKFRERFEDAERISPIKGWGLPLGSKPRPMAGDGWMLVGDAASLIDPFTGEGIGNAMISGLQSARWAVKAHAEKRFDEAFLKDYGNEVIALLKDELRMSHILQRLVNHPWLLNLVIRKAARSKDISRAISCMFEDMQEREKLITPSFYLKVLFA